ncbi:GNAT family N-acetyltransferase [Streptomyces sp. SKN60]|uniref:GNAT family N-acetyltransferase n=1 Tax=Streptomyces sp. SKN60 TaxID=2855506 RepID=UPI0022461746|nr:GNAT family N-acetyltransferase [Streptomyces sp. SKN60]MCX2185023.1 GNAT family N-acetyltransferase [Streptomyces sp. SKN60]
MTLSSLAMSWCVDSFFVPQEPDAATAARLERCREFRARVLFDGGRRPEFRAADGRYVDAQVLDLGSWHFTARQGPGGPVIGYIRLVTPGTVEHFQSRVFLGPERFTALLRVEEAGAGGVFEHSRLVVDATARGLGLGAYMYAVAMAAARQLGAEAMIGISGTADGQFRLYKRFGFHIVKGTRSYVEHYGEDVCVIFNHTADGAGEFEALVERLHGELDVRPSTVAR